MPPRIYADHAATTPVRDEVISAMVPYLGAHGFNASSLHAEGPRGARRLSTARARASPRSSGRRRVRSCSRAAARSPTTSRSWARRAPRRGAAGHVVTAASEHHAVLRAFELLRDDGFDVDRPARGRGGAGSIVPPTWRRAPAGHVPRVADAREQRTGHRPSGRGARARSLRTRHPLSHRRGAGSRPDRDRTCASSASICSPCRATSSSARRERRCALRARGHAARADDRRGAVRRAAYAPGTENVSGIVGFARALELAVAELPAERARLERMRDGFERSVLATIPDTRVNAAAAERLPNVSSIAFDGAERHGAARPARSRRLRGVRRQRVCVRRGRAEPRAPRDRSAGRCARRHGSLLVREAYDRAGRRALGNDATLDRRAGPCRSVRFGYNTQRLGDESFGGMVLTQSIEWWSIGVGIMALLFGIAILVLCLSAAGLLARIERRSMRSIGRFRHCPTPIAATLTHVGGIADTADSTIARLGTAIGQLEYVAAAATRTTNSIGTTLANLAANFKKSKPDPIAAGDPLTSRSAGIAVGETWRARPAGSSPASSPEPSSEHRSRWSSLRHRARRRGTSCVRKRAKHRNARPTPSIPALPKTI